MLALMVNSSNEHKSLELVQPPSGNKKEGQQEAEFWETEICYEECIEEESATDDEVRVFSYDHIQITSYHLACQVEEVLPHEAVHSLVQKIVE